MCAGSTDNEGLFQVDVVPHVRTIEMDVGKALMRQLRLNLGALHIQTLRTEVAWHDFELLGFFKSEGFGPAERVCLECPVDPTAPLE